MATAMAINQPADAEIAHWTRRITELEVQFNAATKLSEIKAVAASCTAPRKR
jgi:hypothetical protein